MSGRLRVLIVEDSEDDALLLVRELRRSAGYDPVFERVETPAAMKAALTERGWDIIIADYSMPEFSGAEALILLRETHLDVPLIVVSGVVGEEFAVAMMRAGAADYISKGNLARLCPAVERELREAQVRRGHQQAELALHQSEERFCKVFRASPAAISITTLADGRFVDANDRFLAMMGYRREDLIGRRSLALRIWVDPNDRAKMVASLGEQGSLRDLPTRFRTRSGAVRDISLSAEVVELGGEICLLAICQDVSQKKLAHEPLRRSAP